MQAAAEELALLEKLCGAFSFLIMTKLRILLPWGSQASRMRPRTWFKKYLLAFLLAYVLQVASSFSAPSPIISTLVRLEQRRGR